MTVHGVHMRSSVFSFISHPMTRSLLLLLCSLVMGMLSLEVHAQQEEYFTKEWGVSVGMSQPLDDTNPSLLSHPGVSFGGTMRWIRNSRLALRTSLNIHTVGGNTSGLRDFYPVQAQGVSGERLAYSYSGTVLDLSAVYEIHFLPYGYYRSYLGNRRLVPYMQLGLGAAYASKSGTITPLVPIGIGVKYKLRPRLNLSLDWSMRFSLSDKWDGLDAPHALKSDFFRNKDHVGLLQLTLTYDFSPRCPTCNKAD